MQEQVEPAVEKIEQPKQFLDGMKVDLDEDLKKKTDELLELTSEEESESRANKEGIKGHIKKIMRNFVNEQSHIFQQWTLAVVKHINANFANEYSSVSKKMEGLYGEFNKIKPYCDDLSKKVNQMGFNYSAFARTILMRYESRIFNLECIAVGQQQLMLEKFAELLIQDADKREEFKQQLDKQIVEYSLKQKEIVEKKIDEEAKRQAEEAQQKQTEKVTVVQDNEVKMKEENVQKEEQKSP
jgi:hypothetical protein